MPFSCHILSERRRTGSREALPRGDDIADGHDAWRLGVRPHGASDGGLVRRIPIRPNPGYVRGVCDELRRFLEGTQRSWLPGPQWETLACVRVSAPELLTRSLDTEARKRPWNRIEPPRVTRAEGMSRRASSPIPQGTSRAQCVALLIAALAVRLAGAGEAEPLRTDPTKALVPLDQIRPGGPPPDGIPAIDHPVFVPPVAAAAWLGAQEPVLAL